MNWTISDTLTYRGPQLLIADTNAERQAALKERREKAGLVLVRQWVSVTERAKVEQYCAKLPETKARREKARVK